MGRRRGRALAAVSAVATSALLLTGCASPASLSAHRDGKLRVITTIGIIRDLVERVGGDAVEVDALVPDGADPHSYEPTMRDMRDVVYADVAFSNYALLEEHAIIRALDANLRPGTPNVALAEQSASQGAELIQLVENMKLDTIWLGLRVRGTGASVGATRTSDAHIYATGKTGPGDVIAYFTGTFGDATVAVNSRDGFDAANGYRGDSTTLPPDAHSHLSWVFTEPGVYTLDVSSDVQPTRTDRPVPMGSGTLTFAVGVDPIKAGKPGATVLDAGHADISANLTDRKLEILHDPTGMGDHQTAYDSANVVVSVPSRAISEIPAEPRFRFLGDAGKPVYQLAQAVLGKHVHGEIDPHLWHSVHNAQAYVKVIRDELKAADPAHAATYTERATAYLGELDALDAEVHAEINAIPKERRHLVTTHDAFGYLGKTYGLDIAGFVTPNPAVETSIADRRRLAQTIEQLQVPAVFLEPNLASRTSTLTEVAHTAGIAVCPIYGDAFDNRVQSYVELMRFNARSIRQCLTA